jgi:hypothetical protein
LQRLEEDEFLCAALAFDVVGRAEHPDTKSARLESAVAKLICTELVQRVVELAEEIHGLAGQTTAHRIEKCKRDARVLTIYEGTSEIQRFLILRDLANEVAPRWAKSPPRAPQHLAREALELESLKGTFRRLFDAALALFGPALWQNPNLQATVFALPEAAAWLKAAASVLGRMAWLYRHGGTEKEPAPRHPVGARALARALAEVRDRLRRFDDDLAHLRRGHYAPHVRAATLLFDRSDSFSRESPAPAEPTLPEASRLNVGAGPVLVIVEPFAADVPEPCLRDGRILDPHWCLNAADRAALETALQLRDAAPNRVVVEVAAVGPPRVGQALREALSLGVARARLVVTPSAETAPDAAASVLVRALRGSPFDTVLWGDAAPHAEGAVGMLVAAALGVRHRVPVKAGTSLRPWTTADYCAYLARGVEVLPWPADVPAGRVVLGHGANRTIAAGEKPLASVGPADAAQGLRDSLGLGDVRDGADSYAGPITDVSSPPRGHGQIVAVVAADPSGRLKAPVGMAVSSARSLAVTHGAQASVLLVVSADEIAQRTAIGRLAPWLGEGVCKVNLIVWNGPDMVPPAVLRECLAGAAIVIGEPWTEPLVAGLGRWADGPDRVSVRARSVGHDNGALTAETTRMGGKVVPRQLLAATPGGTLWISLGPHAEGVDVPERRGVPVAVHRWSGGALLPQMAHVLAAVRREVGVTRLADADVILDVGFGVGGRDGFDAVIAPLERALRDLGVRGLVVGGSRKVTDELHLLPPDRQIGQSGVAVNPHVLIAVGVSGAPQHLNYVGPRAVIVAFNRDPEAPLMTLNQRQPRPRVIPVVGDLFETVPALTAALRDGKA